MPSRLKPLPRIPGIRRLRAGESLHPHVLRGLKRIAHSEQRSLSWVMAEIISDYFKINAATGEVRRRRRAK